MCKHLQFFIFFLLKYSVVGCPSDGTSDAKTIEKFVNPLVSGSVYGQCHKVCVSLYSMCQDVQHCTRSVDIGNAFSSNLK